MITKKSLLYFVGMCFLGVCIIISSFAEGDCSYGIRKEHLDTTPGAFVDNSTIEIDETNGLQIKDGGVTSDKLAAGLIPTVNVNGVDKPLKIKCFTGTTPATMDNLIIAHGLDSNKIVAATAMVQSIADNMFRCHDHSYAQQTNCQFLFSLFPANPAPPYENNAHSFCLGLYGTEMVGGGEYRVTIWYYE